MEQDLIKTLKAPTEDQPQIPFPGTTASTTTTTTTRESTSSSSKQKQQMKKKKTAKTTASENQQFILPAQLSIELLSPSSSQSQSQLQSQQRPYNGADVLVLQVWTDRPSSSSSSDLPSDLSSVSSVSLSQQQQQQQPPPPPPPKIIGGAQIPIGAIGGNFPVRFSLGPLNSVVDGEEEWKSLLSSKDLWLRASICHDIDVDNDNNAASSPSLDIASSCPTSETSILEGIGFSKWINFNNIQQQQQQQQQQDGGGGGSSDKGGIRAPATVVLTATTTTTTATTIYDASSSK
jgi:hypothetical protein